MSSKKELIAVEQIESTIYEVRGQRVILDSDLAALYGVETKYLVRAFKRNAKRFPQDFVFQLSNQELTDLRCQFGTSRSWGGRRTPPFAFNEHGAIMAATVLNSPAAIKTSHLQSIAPNIPVEVIEQRIYLIRGHKVMLDRHLAELYGVKPIALRQQVKRNFKRFPSDFMFQLSENET